MASQFHKPYHVLFILTEKSGVMSFLHNNESDARLVPVSQPVSQTVLKNTRTVNSSPLYPFFLSLTVYGRSCLATNLHQLIGEALQYSVVDFPWVDKASDGPDFYLNAVK